MTLSFVGQIANLRRIVNPPAAAVAVVCCTWMALVQLALPLVAGDPTFFPEKLYPVLEAAQ